MSHDLYADWAASEISNYINICPQACFGNPPISDSLSVYSTRIGRRKWPIPDGVIRLETGQASYAVALEFKRQNEGTHGILTAIGQAHAYVHQGYSGSLIVIPKSYQTHERPGDYVSDVLKKTSEDQPIGVFIYEEPDPSKAMPFQDKITCKRNIAVDTTSLSSSQIKNLKNVKTQWMHLREGSFTPDACFRYLQLAKQIESQSVSEPDVPIPCELEKVIEKKDSVHPPYKYLSSSVRDTLHDRIWRHFWFKFVFNEAVMPIWSNESNGQYDVNAMPSQILIFGGARPQEFFSARTNSIKNRLVRELNSGNINEKKAWEKYAINVRRRAHSYREDLDSSLEHLGLLDIDGRPTELGYRFVDACERIGNPDIGTPMAILGNALLTNGKIMAFLHYIYRLSEDKFSQDPFHFVDRQNISTPKFDRGKYLEWIESELANNLRVMRKVSQRGGKQRRPFQAELAILRKFDVVKNFRIGVGLEINWPKIQDLIESVV